MSQPTQLVIFFRCQHKETTTIDVDRSSQQNRNFWSRVKKWSSTTPVETKYQQSSSLCTRCQETERKQIEEAAALQSQMAANAARQLAAQDRLLAAPPAQGVSATIAALALPDDETAIQTLQHVQSLTHHQHELEVVNGADWQGHGALAAQRDLHRIVTFWEKHHSEHAGRATSASSSGQNFCAECKKIEISLADPVFRRQAGLSDVKLKNGVWYGTDGMEDPWSAITSFGSVIELVPKTAKATSDVNSTAKLVQPPVTSLAKAPMPEQALQPGITILELKSEDALFAMAENAPINHDQVDFICPSDERGKHLPALDRLAKLQDRTTSPPGPDLLRQVPKALQLEFSELAHTSWLREHRRTMIDIRIKNFHRMQDIRERQARGEFHPVADTEVSGTLPTPAVTPGPAINNSGHEKQDSKPRLLFPRGFRLNGTVPLFSPFSDRASREQDANERRKMTQEFTTSASSSTPWTFQRLEISHPDSIKLMSNIRLRPAEQLASLPVQEEREIEVIEWYDRYYEVLPNLPALPPQDDEELKALLEQDSGGDQDPILALPPLPAQDEEELETLSEQDSQQENAKIPPLQLQDEEVLEILGWYARHQEQVSDFPALPLQDEEELEALSEQECRKKKVPVPVLPPLPTQAEIEALDEDIPLERQHNPNSLPSCHAPADIEPSSPLGVEAIQRIRDYFHIPASIPPSGFQEFWWARSKLKRGMTEDRTLASRASTHRRSTSRANETAHSDLLDEVPAWYFGNSVFLMRSSDGDIEKRIEISNLCDRIMWTSHNDVLEDAVSQWEQSDDEDNETDEELERKRQAAVDAISGDIPNAQLNFPLEIAFDTVFAGMTARPKTPNSKVLESREDPQGILQPIDHSYSESDSELSSEPSSNSNEEDPSDRGTIITAISAPILEDPTSRHNVTIRSLLRSELVLVDWDESGRARWGL